MIKIELVGFDMNIITKKKSGILNLHPFVGFMHIFSVILGLFNWYNMLLDSLIEYNTSELFDIFGEVLPGHGTYIGW